jgi:oligoendopeptidase F
MEDKMDLFKEYPRTFLEPSESLGKPTQIKKAYERLLALPRQTKAQAARFLAAWCEINDAMDDVFVRASFRFNKNTADKKAEKEYLRLIKENLPVIKELDEQANKLFLGLPAEFIPATFTVFRKKAKWESELFRPENLPLMVRNNELETQYDKTVSEWRVEWEGKQVTPTYLGIFLTKSDRTIREKAYRAQKAPLLADHDKLDNLFDQMMTERMQIAQNAGMTDYMRYQYKAKGRLSYTPEDVAAFRDAIKNYVTPVVGHIFKHREKSMGIESTRPWDLVADPEGKDLPVVYRDLADLKFKLAQILHRIDPQFSEAFLLMDALSMMDLDNRPNKAPGAYCSTYSEMRLPLIFANAVGTCRDIDTIIHESGHAMHAILSRHLPSAIRHAQMEFCEVASMSLELLARPYLAAIYTEDDWRRISRKQLEETLAFLPFMAMLDEFQSWVYLAPEGKKAKARGDFWEALEDKYRPHINWKGLEAHKRAGWMYNHVFTVPFYYVEYGIAQVGALQVFLRSLKDYRAAVRDYKQALTLGSSVGLPELFKTAGIKLVLKEPTVLEDVVKQISKVVEL